MLIHGIINAKNKHDFPDIKDVLFGTFCRFVSISKSEHGNKYNIVVIYINRMVIYVICLTQASIKLNV